MPLILHLFLTAHWRLI